MNSRNPGCQVIPELSVGVARGGVSGGTIVVDKDLSFGKKPPISLVPPAFITEVSKCMEDGAKKRSPYNWRAGKVSAMQLLDKILRHTLDCLDGSDLTEDSKLSNLASAAADIAVYIDAQREGVLVDDRPRRNK